MIQNTSSGMLCVTGLARLAFDPRRYLIAKKRIKTQIKAVKKTAIARA